MSLLLKYVIAYTALLGSSEAHKTDFKFIFASNVDDARSLIIESILEEAKKETPDFKYEKVRCSYHQNMERCDAMGYDNPLNLFPAKLYI